MKIIHIMSKYLHQFILFWKKVLVYPVNVSIEEFEKCMDLLLITDENKPHYVCIKDFHRFMCNNKNKKHFWRYCLRFVSSEKFLMEHKKVCLKINCKQSVKLKGG